ncbi:unnamed protein product [Phytomonas sp. Hart1]|nr:unnamed protein product [Phytomonas sp. Hart1]|eukprot:CCW69948.1 unnamed protein product [Phytomonas sp. isolate Hart1]
MLLISWNVAGWSATVRGIRESYGSVARFFHQTGADIICLQECKGTWDKLQTGPVEMGVEDPPVSKRSLAKAAPPALKGASPSHAAITNRGAPITGETMRDWESFWSFSKKVHKGFNGVVTFVRKGRTIACDARPFGKDDLDDEGRVVVTYHSAFVLFNVYVPNARGCARSEYKRYFLNSLVSVMDRVRQTSKKPLVLVGDLNMTYRAEDAAWTLRRLHIGKMVELNQQSRTHTAEAWEKRYPYLSKPALSRLTATVVQSLWLRALEIVNPTASSPLKAMDDKGLTDAVHVDHESRKDSSQSTTQTSVVSVDSRIRDAYDKGGSGIPNEPRIEHLKTLCQLSTAPNPSKKGPSCMLASSQPNAGGFVESTNPPMTLAELYEAGFSSIFVDEIAPNPTARVAQHRELYALTRYCGLPPHDDESIAFMGRLLHHAHPPYGGHSTPLGGYFASAMRDTFTLTPNGGPCEAFSGSADCPCPFTCWDQSRNRRQVNEGTRLDYILVDRALAPYVRPPTNSKNNLFDSNHLNHQTNQGTNSMFMDLSNGCYDEEGDFFGEFSGGAREEGVRRARGDGLYPSAAFDRSGIPQLSSNALDIPFRGLPSTGLFLTPPQFSDHIGVCALFHPSIILEPHTDKISGAAKCQYRPPVSLSSFFTKTPSSKLAPATNMDGKMANHARNTEQNSKLFSEKELSDSPKEKKAKIELDNGLTEIINVDSVEKIV